MASAAVLFAGAACGDPARDAPRGVDADGGAESGALDAGGNSPRDDAAGADDAGEETRDAGHPFDAFVVDVPNLVRRSNIVLGRANGAPQESMPLGNGSLGVAAWAANGFTAQLNRADTMPDRRAVARLVIPALA